MDYYGYVFVSGDYNNKSSSTTLNDETQDLVNQLVERVKAQHEALQILLSSSGALWIEKTPSSGDQYVYDGSFQGIIEEEE
jgi:uncharacterized protein YbbK (DUF523 family)